MSTAESTTEVWLLGPLDVRVEGRAVPIARPKQRSLLAVLALDAGSCVSRERLIDELWGSAPPSSAAHGLQVHVSGLRKLLGAGLIVTCPGGYKLALDPDAVDAHRAAALVAAGDPEGALALFRGVPLEDVELEGPAAHEAARLDDLRVAALEERFDRALAAGEGAALVGPLERLVEESPLRERPRGQLMLALYRAGRQADALAAFQDARRTFVDELGIEPSPALREIERAILQQDDSLAVRVPRADEAPAPRRHRRLLLLGAVAFAGLASAAGVAVAYLISPGHPGTASARPEAIVRTRARISRGPVRVSTHPAATKRIARRHVARRAPVVVAVAPKRSVPAHAQRRPAPVPTPLPTTTTHAAPPPATTAHATTTSHVATHPVRTTPLPAPTTTAAPSGPVHIVDTFDKSVVDDTTWNVLVNGIGADAVQRNGKLVISVAANSKPGGSYNFVGIQYGTRQCFSGDIDMQVDYRLVTWPAGSGAYVGLQAVFADAMVERFSPPEGGADIYGSMIRPRWTSQPASGTTGSLRLQRVGGVVTTYYLAGGAWQPVDTGPAAGAAHLHIGLSLNPGITPTSGIAVELDNFSATAAGPISGC